MKKILSLLVALVFTATSAFAFIDSYTVSRKDLPEDAQEMLSKYFPKAKVSLIKVDRHLLKKTDYDVRLTNGTTVEFTNKGKWTSVTSKSKALPDDLIPAAIRKYVAKNYSDVKIVSIHKRNAGYDIGLSDEITLRFNLLGQFKGVKMEGE